MDKEELKKNNESTEDTLTLFREKVSKVGYHGIKADMIPVVEKHGTTKDKVALVINAHFDMKRDKKTPLLSRKQADDIKAEIKTHGRTEMVEFMNCLSLYDALRNILNLFYRVKYAYLSMAYQATIYFQTYEWLGEVEELFNSFVPLVAPDKQKEFKQLTEKYNNYLQNYQRFGELEEVNGKGWIDRQRSNCFDFADVITTELCKNKLSQLKGAIEAIEKWVQDNKAEMFVSMELRDQLFDIQTGDIQELQSKYYHSHLKYMEERGDTPTDEDKKIALFPSYDEVEADDDICKFIYKKLDGYKETYK